MLTGLRATVCAALLVVTIPSAAAALTIQGASFITPSTTIPGCSFAECNVFGSNILAIADGVSTDFNGWAGASGQIGTIKLDLAGNFDLSSFSLWNDININREGVGDFRLRFYDAADSFLGLSSTFTAPIGQSAPGVYSLAPVSNVSRVDLEVLTLLTGGACCRIEIREVAFEGVNSGAVNAPIPEPGTWALMLGGFGVAGAMLRRRRNPATRAA